MELIDQKFHYHNVSKSSDFIVSAKRSHSNLIDNDTSFFCENKIEHQLAKNRHSEYKKE